MNQLVWHWEMAHQCWHGREALWREAPRILALSYMRLDTAMLQGSTVFQDSS